MKEKDVRVVRFKADQRWQGEDLYWCAETSRVLIRQECDDDHVRWFTASKWTGGYEADCPLREGLVMRAVDKAGNVLFEEKIVKKEGYSDTVAEKEGPFSWEAIYALAEEIDKENSLLPYEEWKPWVTEDMPEDSKEYPENWMFDVVDYGPVKKLARLDLLGVTVFATVQEAEHIVSHKKWLCYEIQDARLERGLALCGYKFEK